MTKLTVFSVRSTTTEQLIRNGWNVGSILKTNLLPVKTEIIVLWLFAVDCVQCTPAGVRIHGDSLDQHYHYRHAFGQTGVEIKYSFYGEMLQCFIIIAIESIDSIFYLFSNDGRWKETLFSFKYPCAIHSFI